MTGGQTRTVKGVAGPQELNTRIRDDNVETEGEKRRVQDILGVSNLQALARNPEPQKGILVPYNPMPESEMMSARVALTNPSKAGMDANTGSNAERGCQK